MPFSLVPASGIPLSAFTAPLVAALVGIAGALAVVLAAADAVGASRAETVSWVAGLGLTMAATSALLSWRFRIPVITAWSTPGAAVIAATQGIGIRQAVGAFLLANVLIVATAAIKPLGRLIERIPLSIAAAMLAGVLLRFVTAMVDSATVAPWQVLPLIALFLVMRRINASLAMLLVLAVAVLMAAQSGKFSGFGQTLQPTQLVWVWPVFDPAILIGLGLPLYLVTMASQNLPGAAVIRAAGYQVPFSACLGVTGVASLLTAPLTAHGTNLAAITAAICVSPDAHPDKDKRWQTGVVYGVIYTAIALAAGPLVSVFAAVPPPLMKTVAGLGLIGALTGALAQALGDEKTRFSAVLTFVVTASGVVLGGIGSAFWGLVAGLAVLVLDGVRVPSGGPKAAATLLANPRTQDKSQEKSQGKSKSSRSSGRARRG
jgi:benzoate membrane transport protein